LYLGQCLVCHIDITQLVGEASQLEQGGDGRRIPRGRGVVLQIAGAGNQNLVIIAGVVKASVRRPLAGEHGLGVVIQHALKVVCTLQYVWIPAGGSPFTGGFARGANAAFDAARPCLLGPMVLKTDLIVDLT